MKKIITATLLVYLVFRAFGEVGDTTLTEKNVREKILNDIKLNLNTKNKAIDSTIINLDSRVGKLDSVIKVTGNPRERIDKLVERVQVLEEKQKAIEQNEINVYEANYQSAIINLVSMEREIKPLLLFHATKDFFSSLNETTNPFNYDGFRGGFDKFREYVDKIKDESATQKAISEFIGASGGVTADIPVVGAYSQLLFSGMADYINSIGHNKRELKEQAERMFSVTASLSQFTTEKNLIENEWEGISLSLGEMQGYYDTVVNRNLDMLGIDRDELTTEFTRQSDASKRYAYLTNLRQQAAQYVIDLKSQEPKDWKENIYYELMDVQSLKVKYGDITYRVKSHIDKYSKLINRFKSNKEIGAHVNALDSRLNQLKATFDDAFEPAQYVHAATQMYKVM